MKRIGNLYHKIIAVENLKLADKKARKHKLYQHSVKEHLQNEEANIQQLHELLRDKKYRTSEYTRFPKKEGKKEREIFRLPFFPDRICHHAVMNVLEEHFVNCFIAQTYSCIKGRGVHGAHEAVIEALRDIPGTKFCLKLDIKKFYPSIDHDVMKSLLRRKFKDPDLLWLLDEIIDSTDGLPIGNYLSQYFANFCLTYFDHWIKENKRVKNYFRYADDIVILADNKSYLHELLSDIKTYLSEKLKLTVKENYQVFPVAARGIDFCGVVYFHGYRFIRKSIKQACARKLAKGCGVLSISAYHGWFLMANSKQLRNKLYGTQFCRLQHTGKFRQAERRQNSNSENIQQTNTSSELQHQTKQENRI